MEQQIEKVAFLSFFLSILLEPEPTISYALNTFKTQKKVFYISWA